MHMYVCTCVCVHVLMCVCVSVNTILFHTSLMRQLLLEIINGWWCIQILFLIDYDYEIVFFFFSLTCWYNGCISWLLVLNQPGFLRINPIWLWQFFFYTLLAYACQYSTENFYTIIHKIYWSIICFTWNVIAQF